MQALPAQIFTVSQIYALERYAIDDLGVPAGTLMERAGEAAFAALGTCWPSAQRIVVLCGGGNNAGDGYVLARLARADHLNVIVVPLSDPATLPTDARAAYERYVAAGGKVERWEAVDFRQANVVIDAIFGTGLNRRIDAALCEKIVTINAANVPILALDIPSGLHGDTGQVLGVAVRAHRTVTFVGLKLGFYVGEGVNYTGTVMFDDLGIPADAPAKKLPEACRIDDEFVSSVLTPRNRTTHKGAQGHVLLIAGGPGMGGAARLAGEAALRAGAGLVTVATSAENIPGIIAGCPELICRAIDSVPALTALLERADVLAVGPGLGQDSWAEMLVGAALDADKPTVVDADALNLLARHPRRRTNWILTPHPGEAGRLLGWSTQQVQNERLNAVREIARRYGGVAVLKGAGTIVLQNAQLPAICDRGNPGMASAGMGDVLTGIIAGVVAQVSDLWDAARAGVIAHATAGDFAAHRGERGLLASDLFAQLQKCVNPLPRS